MKFEDIEKAIANMMKKGIQAANPRVIVSGEQLNKLSNTDNYDENESYLIENGTIRIFDIDKDWY